MKIIFAGTPGFAASHLQALINSHHHVSAVICQPDKPGKRGRQPQSGPVKKTAMDAGLRILQPARLSAGDLQELDFDLLVVVAYGQILNRAVLEYPRFGCINVHASLLPRWRGAAPVQRSILAGDTVTGTTIMLIDEGLDTGDMLASKALPIGSEDTSGSILEKMVATGAPLLIDTIDKLEAGILVPEQQNDADACYATKIRTEEAHINWADSATNIDLLVRAFQPAPVAFTYIDNVRVKIHRGYPIDGSGSPGTLINLSKNGLDIACGEGAYRVESIQLSIGKGKIMNPTEVINGRADLLNPGVVFGPATADV